jgi:protein O-mannosyl-transferase
MAIEQKNTTSNTDEKLDFLSKKSFLQKQRFTLAVIFVLGLLLFAYKDHFHNPFHFDDDHTIVKNAAIRNIKNIPKFFTDAKTFSSLPANQIYRPGVTTLNAIDYWIGGQEEPNPFYFHISIFISYILLGLLLFLFLLKIFEQVQPSFNNRYFALFGAGLYCLHTANAETINYVIARSDSFSTLMIILALVIYQYKPDWRSKYIYIIPVIIGFFVKEPTIMTSPLLFIYILFFEKNLSLKDCFQTKGFKIALASFVKMIPIFSVSILLYLLSKNMAATTFSTGETSTIHYILTQPFAIIHYINNFFLPVNLSADTDWSLISSVFDDRVLIGAAFVLGLIIYSSYASSKPMLRPLAFGIFWFFLALLPTSIIPLAEVINDHRTFFPYIGLVISTAWLLKLVSNKYAQINYLMIGIPILVLIGHAYGTIKRTELWSSGEKLWYDVTIKSPNNGRGLMNYGISQMAIGKYDIALQYLEKAKKITPRYNYLFINLGILKSELKKPIEAEADFKTAIKLNPMNPEGYYFYSNFLISQERYVEANKLVSQGIKISPDHIQLKLAEQKLNNYILNNKNVFDVAFQHVQEKPTAKNFLELSLVAYQNKKYEECIDAANNAIKLNSNFAEAYNNICSAQNMLGNFEAAAKAGKKGLQLQPGYLLIENNLKVSLSRKKICDSMNLIIAKNPTYENYINLSLLYYNFGCYQKCVEASTNALLYDTNSDIAYNNICSAYNMLEKWELAIEAGEKGLKISPKNELLKNNLLVSINGKAALKK